MGHIIGIFKSATKQKLTMLSEQIIQINPVNTTLTPSFYYCELYKVTIQFCIGWPKEAVKTYLKSGFKWTGEIDDDSIGQMCPLNTKLEKIFLIWTRDREDVVVLAHECLHAANQTLNHVGWTPQLLNDEPQTYLFENIFSRALLARHMRNQNESML